MYYQRYISNINCDYIKKNSPISVFIERYFYKVRDDSIRKRR
jgi:hypothetical protein